MTLHEQWKRLVSFIYKHEAHYLYCCDIERVMRNCSPLLPQLTSWIIDAKHFVEAKAAIDHFPEIMATRVNRGNLAFMAVHERKWVFRSSVVLGPCDHLVTGYALHLGSRDAYLECAVTLPEWRGRGVAPGMMRITMNTLYERGYRQAFLTIITANAASCRAAEKGGARRIGIITGTRRFGRWRSSYEPLSDGETYHAVVS